MWFEDVLDKTRILDTKELVISKGFLKELREYFGSLKIMRGEMDKEKCMEKKE